MAKEELIKLEGMVAELLPNARFKVEIDGGTNIIAYLGGKLRQFDINIQLGDKVELECSPYDLTKGRIIYRR